MENTFTLILVIFTLVTGFLWCINKIMHIFKHRKNNKILKENYTDSKFNQEILTKIFSKKSLLKNGASFFPILSTVLIVRSFIYEPFQIPSGSMMPTLLIGDFILVEKFSYGIKDSIFHKTLIKTGYPKRGDIVVFKYPENPHLDYIKRAVGLPGDKITYDPITKEISIHPSYNSDISSKNTLPITYSNIEPSDFVQTFEDHNGLELSNSFFKISQSKNKWNGIRLMECQETLGNITHSILTVPIAQDHLEMYYRQPDQQLATWIVMPKHYFVMGDNRDNSLDSRYWGFVPEENLIGKAIAIWMSFEKQEGKWPTNVRLNRIGKIY